MKDIHARNNLNTTLTGGGQLLINKDRPEYILDIEGFDGLDTFTYRTITKKEITNPMYIYEVFCTVRLPDGSLEADLIDSWTVLARNETQAILIVDRILHQEQQQTEGEWTYLAKKIGSFDD